MFKGEKELWSKFACAALNGCVNTLEGRIDKWNESVDSPVDYTDEEEQIEDDCFYAAQYADRMVAIFKEKFKDC